MRLLLAALLAAAATGHEYFPGQCPNFAPMAGFEWDKVSWANMLENIFQSIEIFLSSCQFSSGIWYVTRKFSTKSSCLTYEFKTDDEGFKSVEQVRVEGG